MTARWWLVLFGMAVASCVLGAVFHSNAATGLGIAAGVVSLVAVS